MSFSIKPVGDCFSVYDENDVCVGGPYDRIGKAEASLKGFQTRAKKAASIRRRDCMRCTKPFPSEGIHNRLCDHCRKLGGGLD